MEPLKIMIVGVGGQGTLLASKLLGRLYMNRGCDIKVSEVHGMSQRGGSVVTHVSCGDRVCSPIVDRGEADFILSFEMLEAARWVPYLRTGGLILTNTRQISPMPVITGAADYPSGLADRIRELGLKLDAFDALTPALESGSARAVNLVLLGRFSRYLDFSEEEWQEAIRACVPAGYLEMNLTAWQKGRSE